VEKNIKYLIDTNVWLERLLDQEKSNIVQKLFDFIPTNQLFISDFSLHSIGVILSRFKRTDVFNEFVDDLFFNGTIELVSLEALELKQVISNIQKHKLDFDDSYQLTISEKYNLTILTFDKNFKIEGIKKKTPDEIIR